MAQTLDDLNPRAGLVEVARDFHARGWMAGTAGNISVREDGEHFWITASGRPKGRLDERDFLLMRLADEEVVERLRPGDRPSAETAIHRALYRLFPDARACLHVHSVEACIADDTIAPAAGDLALPALEMIKGFDIWEQTPNVVLPVFENHLNVGRIAEEIRVRFSATPPALSALIVRGHGPTVWGDSLQQAYDRVECLEFLLAYLARKR